jgi:hypothetical protein
VLRTIHSFDPCMACAAHVFGPQREEVVTGEDPMTARPHEEQPKTTSNPALISASSLPEYLVDSMQRGVSSSTC